MKLSKNSWHYRLATTYANEFFFSDEEIDFCLYVKKVISGVLLAMLITAVISVWLGGLVDAALWCFVVVTEGQLIRISPYGGTVVPLTVLLLSMVGLGWVSMKLYERRYAKKLVLIKNGTTPAAKHDSFFSLLMTRIRNRVCFKVELID